MGKGALDAQGKSFEGKTSTHGMPLSAAGASFEKTISHLGGDPEHPFVIFEKVQKAYHGILEEKRKRVAKRRAAQAVWEKANPELAAKYRNFLEGKLPEIDFSAIVQKAGAPTRGASGAVLASLAGKVENLIVASADLSNSDKTDAYLKNTTAFTTGRFHRLLPAGRSQ